MPQSSREWLHQTTVLEKARNRYLDSLMGIRELADFAEDDLPKPTRARHVVMVRLLSSYGDGEPNAEGFNRTLMDIMNDPNKETIEIPGVFTEALAQYRDSFPPGTDTSILDDIVVIRTPRRRLDLLLSSLLVATVSDFEVLFSAIVSFLYRLRPQALRAQNPRMTWTEIETHRSIEEIKAHLIEERVAQLMWGGFDDWISWLSTQLKIEMADIAPEGTEEVFQRRHVVVHNGGLASPQYLAKIPSSLSLGDSLPVTSEYLVAALDKLTVLGVLAVYRTMRKLAGNPAEHGNVDRDIHGVIRELIQDQCWQAAKGIASVVSPEVNPEERENISVYRWTAIRELQGVQAIQEEVELWDSPETHFRLMKKILLNDPDAVEYARNLAAAQDSNVGIIKGWPVMSEFWAEAIGSGN